MYQPLGLVVIEQLGRQDRPPGGTDSERGVLVDLGSQVHGSLQGLTRLHQAIDQAVPVGGGGMISGIALAIKEMKPDVRIIGVEADAAASAKASRDAGEVVKVAASDTLADGIATKRIGEITYPLIERYVDDLVSVGEEEIAAAYQPYEGAEPLEAPGWFDCFDADEIGAALEAGEAMAYLSVANITYGIDRIAAVFPDGRGYVWHQINHCGEVVFDGRPAPEGCPTPPETN